MANSPVRWLATAAALLLALALGSGQASPAAAQVILCPAGFDWQRLSGVGCVQAGCGDVAPGISRLDYTGHCICDEQHHACYEPVDYSGFDRAQCGPFCPVSRLAACVDIGQACPGATPAVTATPAPATEAPGGGTGDSAEGADGGLAAAGIAGAGLIGVIVLGTWITGHALSSRKTAGRAAGQRSLDELYNADPESFRQCQDLPYARLWDRPPPGGSQSKSAVYDRLVELGYWEAHQGGQYDPQRLAAQMADLRDGDILMLDTGGLPNVRDAHHYAVVENGRIYQILNLPRGGEPDVMDVGDAMAFFRQRQARSIADGKVYDCAPYYGVRVFRRPSR